MDYQIVLSPSARRDLRDIIRYISLDSPERAVAFGQFLIGSIRQLANFPGMGREVPEFGRAEVREIVVRNYRVIYRLEPAGKLVQIVRFWHGARGNPTL